VSTAFAAQLDARAPDTYADFLLPYLRADTELLDVGCGDGALSVGLAGRCARVTGVDLDPGEFAAAVEYVATSGPGNITFVEGDATRLDFPDDSFDVVLGHSVLESGADPVLVLEEARRVLRPGGWIGVASVEYGGLVLAGPEVDLLRRSNAVREGLWQHSGADPFLGRELRRLLGEAGFADVEATTKAFGYGTPALVRAFGDGRGSECADPHYVAEAVDAGLATDDELAAMADAWAAWGASPAAYAAFTWCRAVGRRPDEEDE
jgi:ubiquinone/menaquinone biosynthesis C-methylase UbiE